MVVKSGGNWKRPVNRMYTYNFQVWQEEFIVVVLESK